MLYFAYGSNLSTLRLTQRIPSAELVTTGRLRGHRLLFHKIGRDGSAKCDACFTGNQEDFMYGAIYMIHPDLKVHLDRAEGLGMGYETKDVSIFCARGEIITAFTYFATRINAGIKPFHWYREHVLHGVIEHCFPKEYREKIELVDCLEDHDEERSKGELRIYGQHSPT